MARTVVLVVIEVIGPVNEHDGISILLDGTRITEVSNLRCVVGSLRRVSGQLRERDDRNLELLGHELEAP